MKIAVLGPGEVGKRLASGFVSVGHQVKLGSRDPKADKVKSWVAANGKTASAGSLNEAAAFGEIVVITTPWSGFENAIKLAGPDNFKGKVVIDVTNPLVFHENGPPTLGGGYSESAGEQMQRRLRDARVVKAFNIVGNAHFIHPQFGTCGPPDMFICGNDDVAKKDVTGFLKQFGWSVIDIGGIEGARLLEPLAMLWITYAIQTGGWNHAFKLLHK